MSAPRTNREVAAAFERQSNLLAIQQANPFRVRAYRNAAESIRRLSRPLHRLIAEREDLTKLPAIGKDLAQQIEEIMESGASHAMMSTERDVPPSLIELLDLPGLGPARVNRLFTELGISSRDELENALRDGRVSDLRGFGSALEQRLLNEVSACRTGDGRKLLSNAIAVAKPLVEHLEACPHVVSATVCGSCRRGKPTIGDIDIVLVSKQPARALEFAATYRNIKNVEMEGETRSSFHLKGGMQVDLRAVLPKEAGSAILYFTGNKQHNIRLRRRAQNLDRKLNEYGLFAGTKSIAGRTERSIYRALGLAFIPPELRQGTDEIELAAASKIPKLIESTDIKGDLHVIAKPQRAAIAAMLEEALRQGHQYMGLVVPWIPYGRDQKRQMARVRASIRKFREAASHALEIELLAGLKVALPQTGEVAVPDELLDCVDYVIAAITDDFQLARKEQTDRVIAAIRHPTVRILAHPLCRDLRRQTSITLDLDRTFTAAAECGCFLEINGDPNRMDLPEMHCKQAQRQGVTMTIGSGAENPELIESRLRFGTITAKRGWITRRTVANCLSLKQIRARLQTP